MTKAVTIQFSDEPRTWLETQVAESRFDSIEQAVQCAVTVLKSQDTAIDCLEEDEEALKELIEEGRASLAKDGGMSLEDYIVYAARRRLGR